MQRTMCISLIAASFAFFAGIGSFVSVAHANAPTSERIASLSAELRRTPLAAELLLDRGSLYRIEGQWDRARRDLGLAAGLDPRLAASAELEQAALELGAGRPAVALVAARHAHDALPLSADARRLLARAHSALGEMAAAAAAFDEAIERANPPRPEDFLDRADHQLRAGVSAADVLAGIETGIDRLGPAFALVRRANSLRVASPSSVSPASLVSRPIAPRMSSRPHSAVPGKRTERPGPPDNSARLLRGPYLQLGTPTSIVVRWRTDVPTDSRVAYGTELTNTWTPVEDATMTTEHEVEIDGLEPETRYFYSIGHSEGEGARRTLAGGDADFSFTTSPKIGSAGSTRIWVIGDSGTGNRNARAVRDAWTAFAGGRAPDVWLMLGDNAYETGTDAEYQRAVFEMYRRQLATGVLWPTRGNHDALHAGPGNDYYEFLTLPTRGEAGGLASGSEAYYAFDFANIHFVCLDSEGTSRAPDSPMLAWLEADLAETSQPWTIAFWHHPPYSKGSHDSDDVWDSGRRLVDMRENILPVLERGGVDLVMCGHSHTYERSFLLEGHYGFSPTLEASMKIDAGDGREDGDGAYEKWTGGATRAKGAVYAVAGSSGRISGGSLNHPVMVTSINVLGSLVLDVEGGRLDASFLDSAGTIRDHFTIVKEQD